MLGTFLLRAQVQNEPGFIVGPISKVFGYIIDFIFNIVSSLSFNHSLGFSIIFLTIIVRCLMLPLAAKQQKSMMKMQQINPEVEKIRNKYNNSKDPEIQQKMNAEIQGLYSKHKVNPFSSCLPMFITMPLFFGLSYIMNQSYLFISKLGAIYNELAARIIAIPSYTNYVVPLSLPHVPQKMLDAQSIDISIPDQLSRVLNKFSAADWDSLFSQIPTDYLPRVREIFDQKQAIEMFFGLPLIDASGWAWPGIIIPILAGVTTLLTSYFSNQMTQTGSSDEKTRTTQRTMMIVMPVVMAFMTVSLPAGVGLYWITSSVFQVVQQMVLNARSGIPVFKKLLKKS